MALAPVRQLVLGTVAFLVFWVLAIFPSFKLLPLGRTAGAIAGAVLTVAFQVETVSEAYAAVDLSILGLLFGTMVVSLYLEQADMFRYLSSLLSWKSRGGRDLLCRICILAAVASALFTNDTCCLVLTELILQMCRDQNLPPLPYLIALATSSNIGSVATPIGNPQNLVIAVQSGITFFEFVAVLLPPMLLGVCLNISLLLLAYWGQLSPPPPPDLISDGCRKAAGEGGGGAPELLPYSSGSAAGNRRSRAVVKDASPWAPFHSGILQIPHALLCHANLDANLVDGYLSDPGYSHLSPGQRLKQEETVRVNVPANDGAALREALLRAAPPLVITTSGISRFGSFHSSRSGGGICSDCGGGKWRRSAWKVGVYGVACGMLAAFLYGLDLSWTALTAAVCLMALDFCDAGPNLEKVSYLLLVFFAGMFITVDGFNSTGIPNTLWDIMEPYARINQTSGVIVLTIVIIILSNFASNVPTVLLLGARVSASALESNASVTRGWLILAWASTIAGNLTLVGSAANLIVSEQAMKTHESYGYDLTFFSHIKFGFPSTLIIVMLGLPFINC